MLARINGARGVERARVCVRAYVRGACVRACECVCVRVCACVCARVLGVLLLYALSPADHAFVHFREALLEEGLDLRAPVKRP